LRTAAPSSAAVHLGYATTEFGDPKRARKKKVHPRPTSDWSMALVTGKLEAS
jgi:hypothetical protein